MQIGKYKIESDSMNVTVFQRQVSKKSGNERWNIIGYFATVANALKFLADLGVRESGLKDLRTVSQKQDELYALITTLQTSPETLTATPRPVKVKVNGKLPAEGKVK